jgi:hypothetical protein
MLDADQVVAEAYPRWKLVSFYTGSEPYIPVEIHPYDAIKAIKSVQDEDPDNLFWESLDWDELVAYFIRYADGRLADIGSSYELMMGERSQSIANMQRDRIHIPI